MFSSACVVYVHKIWSIANVALTMVGLFPLTSARGTGYLRGVGCVGCGLSGGGPITCERLQRSPLFHSDFCAQATEGAEQLVGSFACRFPSAYRSLAFVRAPRCGVPAVVQASRPGLVGGSSRLGAGRGRRGGSQGDSPRETCGMCACFVCLRIRATRHASARLAYILGCSTSGRSPVGHSDRLFGVSEATG